MELKKAPDFSQEQEQRGVLICIKVAVFKVENESSKETWPKKKPLIPKGITIQPSTLLIAVVTWKKCNLSQKNKTSVSNPQTLCIFHLYQQKQATKPQNCKINWHTMS